MSTFLLPPHIHNQSNEERMVGFEFEFTGVTMEQVAERIINAYGGSVKHETSYEYKVSNTSLGDFRLEIDTQMLKNKSYEKVLRAFNIEPENYSFKDKIEETLKNLASKVVPFEIITPPIPVTSLDKLDKLINQLKNIKAAGTDESIFYAFGMHFNPEAHSLEADEIHRILSAYILLEPWIREVSNIDVSRQLTTYIQPFDTDYIIHVLDPNYTPSVDRLIRDYVLFGNDRNRSLDFLPLFSHLNADLVQELLPKDSLTSARPTYHYRLPNFSLNDEDWSLNNAWKRWVQVEELAADENALTLLSIVHREMRSAMIWDKKTWVRIIQNWVEHGK